MPQLADVLRRSGERESHEIHPRFETELQILFVLAGERADLHGSVRQIDALVVGQDATVADFHLNAGAGHFDHLNG